MNPKIIVINKVNNILFVFRGLQKQVKNSNVLDVDCVQGAIESAILTLRPTVINNPIFVPSSR